MRRVALIEPAVSAECLTTEMFWQIRLSLPFIAHALKDRGYNCRVFCEELVNLDEKRLETIADGFDVVGISVTINTINRALEIARSLRTLAEKSGKDLTIVFGGIVAGHFARDLLSAGDYCVLGRGEIILPALLQALEQDDAVDGVEGIAFLDGGRLVITKECSDWADHPCDFDSVENYGWFSEKRSILGLPKAPLHSLFFSTGCVNRCRFCMTERRYRVRTVENVIEDLRQILQRHKTFFIPRIMLVDDCPFGNMPKFKQLLREMARLRRDFRFTVMAQFHVRPINNDPELVELLSAAGIGTLLIGFETVSDRSLAHQNKGTTCSENIRAIEICRGAGITPYGYFVVGFETDTPDVVRGVFKFIQDMRLVAQVLPIGITEKGSAGRGTDTTMTSLDPFSFGATVFVSHRHPTMAPARLQALLNEGYERIFSFSRVFSMPTYREMGYQAAYWLAYRRWRPRLAAHLLRLENL